MSYAFALLLGHYFYEVHHFNLAMDQLCGPPKYVREVWKWTADFKKEIERWAWALEPDYVADVNFCYWTWHYFDDCQCRNLTLSRRKKALSDLNNHISKHRTPRLVELTKFWVVPPPVPVWWE